MNVNRKYRPIVPSESGEYENWGDQRSESGENRQKNFEQKDRTNYVVGGIAVLI
jgi:hypothetical protein